MTTKNSFCISTDEELPPDIEQAFSELAKKFALTAAAAAAAAATATAATATAGPATPASAPSATPTIEHDATVIVGDCQQRGDGTPDKRTTPPSVADTMAIPLPEPGTSVASEPPCNHNGAQCATIPPVIPAAAVEAILDGAAVLPERADVLVTDLLDHRLLLHLISYLPTFHLNITDTRLRP